MTTEEAIELIENYYPKEAIATLDPRSYIEVAEQIKVTLEK